MLWSMCDAGAFETLGVRLLQGRGHDSDRQGAQPVVLIGRSTARRFWPELGN